MRVDIGFKKSVVAMGLGCSPANRGNLRQITAITGKFRKSPANRGNLPVNLSQISQGGKCPMRPSGKSSNSRFPQLIRLTRVSPVAFSCFWVYHLFIAFISTLARSTAAEVNFRIDTVYGLLTEGQSRGQIIQFCANQWNVDTRQIDNYIKRARIRLEEDAAMTRPSWIAEALGRLRTYEQSAYKRGQTQVAINSIQLQAKLIGLEI